jgi:DNA repair ATPase RecN
MAQCDSVIKLVINKPIVESTKAKFKDLQMKEQELKTVQIKLGDMMQLMDKRVKQIIELEDALTESNEMITEKDERIEKLQQEVGITSIVIFYHSSSLNSAYISSSFFFCYSLTTLGTRWRDSDRRVEGFVECCD